MARQGQLRSSAVEVTLRVHLVFPGKERRPTFGGSRVFPLDTPIPHPGPAPKGASSRMGTWRSHYTPCSGGGCQDARVKALISFARRVCQSLPGTQPNLASLLWPLKFPTPANSGCTPRGCGHRCPRPLPSAGRSGCQPRASLRDSVRGPGELRPNPPGLHSCPVACR